MELRFKNPREIVCIYIYPRLCKVYDSHVDLMGTSLSIAIFDSRVCVGDQTSVN